MGIGLGFGVGPLRVYVPLTSGRRRRTRSRSRTWSHGHCTIAHRSQGAAERCANSPASRRVEAAAFAVAQLRERKAAAQAAERQHQRQVAADQRAERKRARQHRAQERAAARQADKRLRAVSYPIAATDPASRGTTPPAATIPARTAGSQHSSQLRKGQNIVTASGPHLSGPPREGAESMVARPPRRGGPLRWFAQGGWYLFVVVLSLGILSFVPFVHAATRVRKPLMWLWVVLYTAAVITIFLNVGTATTGGFEIGLMIIASIHSVLLRRQVWPTTTAPVASPAPAVLGSAGWPADAAVAAVLAARGRRDGARRLAGADPQMARELHIGRPDLARTYDDGGLVDLNSAPPQVIAASCGINLVSATQIVDARIAGVPFATVDDVFSLAEIPYPLWDRIRDRAVVITG